KERVGSFGGSCCGGDVARHEPEGGTRGRYAKPTPRAGEPTLPKGGCGSCRRPPLPDAEHPRADACVAVRSGHVAAAATDVTGVRAVARARAVDVRRRMLRLGHAGPETGDAGGRAGTHATMAGLAAKRAVAEQGK